ncbi:hypothetical protein [Lysobacter humi (ex Lee et al. 2017)]
MDDLVTHATPLAILADRLDERRSRILEQWRARVHGDPALAATSDWTRKQFYDHFPDVLEAYGRLLRVWPASSPVAEADQFRHAHAHAKTRWLQGYSLRDLIREWGHFNTAFGLEFHAAREASAEVPARDVALAGTLWSDLVGEQLAESAAEYERLHQAEAATRSEELVGLLERLRLVAAARARSFDGAVQGLRNELSAVVTSTVLAGGAATDSERVELQTIARDGLAALDSALGDLLLLSRLEAGLETREIGTFDASEALVQLLAGFAQREPGAGGQLTWAGPEPYPVQGDVARLRLVARHLLLASLQSGAPGPIDVEWGDDAREPTRWTLLIRQHTGTAAARTSPPIARVIAEATEHAEQAAGVPATGYEQALAEGRVPVAEKDGVHLLIAKHLCEVLAAGIELSADEGVVAFRISLPRSYD